MGVGGVMPCSICGGTMVRVRGKFYYDEETGIKYKVIECKVCHFRDYV